LLYCKFEIKHENGNYITLDNSSKCVKKDNSTLMIYSKICNNYEISVKHKIKYPTESDLYFINFKSCLFQVILKDFVNIYSMLIQIV